MRNYSDTICNKKNRTLTAKGNQFVNRLVDIVAKSKGLTRYHAEFKETKIRIYTIVNYLLIDKEMTIEQIKKLIKSQNLLSNK